MQSTGQAGTQEFAAGAEIGDHRVHEFRRSDNGVDRADLDALRATDAIRFHDARQRALLLHAVRGIERNDRAVEQGGEPRDPDGPTGRAAIDTGIAGGDRFRIRTAAMKTALLALRLRQQVRRSGRRALASWLARADG